MPPYMYLFVLESGAEQSCRSKYYFDSQDIQIFTEPLRRARSNVFYTLIL
jgi:hypothetical protein